MNKYTIWSEGYLATGMEGIPMRAHCIASNVEGETFVDAVKNWYNKDPKGNEHNYGELSIRNGVPCLWGCKLFDNEADARKSFG